MGTVIKNNMEAVRTYNILNNNNAQLQKSMLRISSGERITNAGDDAAGLVISEKMRDRIRADEQANRNVQTGTAVLNVADGALSHMSEILMSMHEKALQAANNAGSQTDDVLAITKELDQLASQITTIANDTKFNGRALISGSLKVTLQVGPESGGWMQALSGNISLTAAGLSLTALSAAAFAGSTAVEGTLSKISNALNTVLSARAKIANVQSRLGYQSDNLTTEAENLQAAESVLRDTDMTKEMTNFMKWNVLSQASQLMLAQAGQNAYSVLNLLQA